MLCKIVTTCRELFLITFSFIDRWSMVLNVWLALCHTCIRFDTQAQILNSCSSRVCFCSTELLLLEQLAQGGTAVGTGLNTKKGYASFLMAECLFFLYFLFVTPSSLFFFFCIYLFDSYQNECYSFFSFHSFWHILFDMIFSSGTCFLLSANTKK